MVFCLSCIWIINGVLFIMFMNH